jgi:hypothetical protein
VLQILVRLALASTCAKFVEDLKQKHACCAPFLFSASMCAVHIDHSINLIRTVAP